VQLGSAAYAAPAEAARASELPPLAPAAFSARRQKLVERLARRLGPQERGLFLALGSGPGNGLDSRRQEPNFFYLSGVDSADAALALPVGSGTGLEALFLREPTERERTYDRPRLAPGRVDWETGENDAERREAIDRTGIRQVESAAHLDAWLMRRLSSADVLFVIAEPVPVGEPLTPVLELVARLRERHPALRVAGARAELDALRLVKDSAEMARIEAAAAATVAGFRRAAARIRPGASEAAVQAEIEAGFRLHGARGLAFPTIVAAGPRSTILHYMHNDGSLEEGAVVIIDAGAQFEGYAADVTRTYPVSGRFDPEQRRLYDKVIEAQEAGVRAAKPGATIDEIDRQVRAVLEKAGLEEGVKHVCCHTVGLEVHDAGESDTELAKGMVITIEPGVYFPDRGIGIRVEDTFAVTGDGVRSLSGDLPRRADDVERFLAESR
jgi:Xaa-Pro aminopeptidase